MSSRSPVRSFLIALAAVAALAAGGIGYAGASTIETALDGFLQPSAAPSLLGPITESGRKGWACKPEQAAAAKGASAAELPPAGDKR